MQIESTTFVNSLGEAFGPLLVAIRATGFFEAYAFIPTMTLLSIFIFLSVKRMADTNGTFRSPLRRRFRYVFLAGYYSLCFLLTNATAVALKTLILEELDYTEPHWYIPYVGPLHFYMASVVLAHLYLIRTNVNSAYGRLLCLYVQFGLIGGYYVAVHRLTTEPFELSNPTTGISGIFFFLWFTVLNVDIAQRFFAPKKPAADIIPPGKVHAH